MLTLVTDLALGIIALAGLTCVARLLRPCSFADRIVALDALLVVVVTGIGVLTVRGDAGLFLDLLVVTSLLGFVGTVTVARFIERRGV